MSFEKERAGESVASMMEGFEFVMRQGAMLALLPIEEWLAAFDRADAIAPILDPTLYREYLYSGKAKILLEVLNAALVFKQAIVQAQEQVKAHPEKFGLSTAGKDGWA